MDIKNLKDLKALIKLCRTTGVDSLKIGALELKLGADPKLNEPQRVEIGDPMEHIPVPQPNIQDPISAAKAQAAEQLKKIQEYIQTDEPSEEQIMMWSTRAEAGAEQ